MTNRACRFLLALAVLLISSCLDGQEEFWFERDGSGRMEVEYQLPVFAVAAMGGEAKLENVVREFFSKQKGIVLDDFVHEKSEAQSVIRIKAHFESVVELVKLFDTSAGESSGSLPDPMRKLLGNIVIVRDGMSVNFKRSIDPKGIIGSGLLAPSREQMEGHHLHYTMHLPSKATSSNAHEVLDGGRTLVWRYPLAEALDHPVETNFIAPIPIPAWLCILIGCTLSVILWLIARFIGRRRKGWIPQG